MSRLRVAAAQIAPVWLNRQASLERVIETIDQAAVAGVELLAFGETLVPGYPFWVERTDGARFDNAFQKSLYAHYVDQAVDLDAGHLDDVCEAARRNAMTVVLGVLERATDRGQSVYASAVTISARGDVVSCHRKLMPTHEERLVWATGDGHGLRTHPVGEFCLGSLNCWENWMPLARASLQAQGETLHVAIWPGSARLTRDITRFMALEGRSFVLSACGLMRRHDFPDELPFRDRLLKVCDDMPWAPGGSCLAGPDGRWIIEPDETTDGLVTAEIDLAEVRRARQNFSPAGHYARPDVLSIQVNRQRQRTADFTDD
ncbi:MAG: carbon-nitrogen hydrolase family protein [Wenzhouxiangella sp.]